MSWIERLMPSRIKTRGRTRSVPEGLWTKCPSCGAALYRAEVERNAHVCPKCAHHMRIGARERLVHFLDPEGFEEIGATLEPSDPLRFRDSKRYRDRLAAAQRTTGEKDALVCLRGSLEGMPVIACAFDFSFMGGSMGSVVGERFFRAAETALEFRVPLICFAASGGARMQEALLSLLQMAKTSAVLARLGEAGVPYVSVLTDPTMGGVSASLAMLGDVNVAEPKALIGFAGPRVIQQTVRETLPEGFQRSEFLLEHGAIDMIVDRRHLRKELSALLYKLTGAAMRPPAEAPGEGIGDATHPAAVETDAAAATDPAAGADAAGGDAADVADVADADAAATDVDADAGAAEADAGGDGEAAAPSAAPSAPARKEKGRRRERAAKRSARRADGQGEAGAGEREASPPERDDDDEDAVERK